MIATPTPPRATKQRAAVMTALDSATEFRSAQEIHLALRARDERIGLTTVYRTLQTLAATGDIDAMRRDDGEVGYRRCSTDHHHHLTCRSCHTTVELSAPQVESWARAVSASHGFADVNHVVELVGLCPECSTPD